MVGVEGFEPPTSCSQSRCATRLRYTPRNCRFQARDRVASRVAHGTDQRRERQSRAFAIARLPRKTKRAPKHPFRTTGAPGEIRTPDHQVRSLVLYPTELRARRTESMATVHAIVNLIVAGCCPDGSPKRSAGFGACRVPRIGTESIAAGQPVHQPGRLPVGARRARDRSDAMHGRVDAHGRTQGALLQKAGRFRLRVCRSTVEAHDAGAGR